MIEQTQKYKNILSALKACWKPNRGIFNLDDTAAVNFLIEYGEDIENLLTRSIQK